MRCPKCSFISFDLVESCTKCGKNISNTAEDLKGTIAEVAAPSFLKVDFEDYEADAVEEAEGIGGEAAVMDLDIDEGDELVDFALEDEGEDDSAVAVEAVDFEIEEEAAVESEPELEIGIEEEPEETLQEEAIDISDLSPAEEPVQEVAEEEFQFEAEEVPPATRETMELEDLEVEGIDLESSSVSQGGKITPSVKTGTALDDFDIDLGDLITSKKEEGNT